MRFTDQSLSDRPPGLELLPNKHEPGKGLEEAGVTTARPLCTVYLCSALVAHGIHLSAPSRKTDGFNRRLLPNALHVALIFIDPAVLREPFLFAP